MKFMLMLALCASLNALAASLAVLEITIPDAPDGDEAQEAELTIAETKYLTDELRRQAAELKPGWNVMSREAILALLPPDMDEAPSAAEIGRLVGADYAASGSVSKLGGLLALQARLYDSQSGAEIGFLAEEAPDLKGLLDAVRASAGKLFAHAGEPPREQAQGAARDASAQGSSAPAYAAAGMGALGAAAIGYGAWQHSRGNTLYKDYKDMKDGKPRRDYDKALDKANSARFQGNMGIGIGAALLCAGAVVYVAF